MTLQALPGTPLALIGPAILGATTLGGQQTTLDAANEAIIMYGRVVTSDGGSHTIDTTGSSKLEWRSAGVTFANAGTTLKVGLATMDTAAGPPARATNAANVITFSVSKSHTGGGGGVTANAWQSNVPDTGTLTVANGDLVAFCVQMTARGGTDSVIVNCAGTSSGLHEPGVTEYVGGAYANVGGVPSCFITFSDGATGWFFGADLTPGSLTSRTFNSGSSPSEYGQLYQLPFPMKIHGLYGWADPDGNFDAVLYSDPLGTPAAQKTWSLDLNVTATAGFRRWFGLFASPYQVAANAPIAAVYKPTSVTNFSCLYKTLGAAGHRVTDVWGTSGYGVSRSSGAFANANSSLDHYYIGLVVGAFDDGAGAAGGAHILGGTVVR